MAWLGVCSTIFCYQHSLPSIVKGFFINFLESYPVDSSLYSQSGAKLRSPPPKKKKGEGNEGTVLLRRPLASVSPWVREGGGGGGVRLHIGHRFAYACLTHGISLLDQ